MGAKIGKAQCMPNSLIICGPVVDCGYRVQCGVHWDGLGGWNWGGGRRKGGGYMQHYGMLRVNVACTGLFYHGLG